MLYPFVFEPIFRPMVWGGEKIPAYKGVTTDVERIGESWEISAYGDKISVVANGPLAGRDLNSLVKEFKAELVGEHVYANTGDEFPLLIKFIDALNDLSIQVHPNNEMAARVHGANANGKTEMWYVIAADPGAALYSGLKEAITPDDYTRMVADGTITDALMRYEVQPGDVFFLPAGRIHAICSGCFIAEIQQTSDLTYRIWDYGRLGLDGKPRQLHTELARQAIDYKVYPEGYKTAYKHELNKEVVLISCPYFTTSLFDLTKPLKKSLKDIDSFLVVMVLEGNGALECMGSTIDLRQGTTVLIPASAESLRFKTETGIKLITSYNT
jgi:mannose-6-phosphate isomerase